MKRLTSTAPTIHGRLLLSLAVTISILQTPLPVAHAHSDFQSPWTLTNHLDRHHHDLDDVRGDELHWHLVIPGQSHEDEQDGSRDDGTVPVAVTASTVSSIAVDSDWMDCRWLPLVGADSLALASFGLRIPKPPLAQPYTLSGSQRACALLCVIRC